MKSRTSFFNPAVFRKNVSLYWPIWGCYLLYGLFKLPGSLWIALQQPNLTEAEKIQAVGVSVNLYTDFGAIAVMTVLCGMALFSYLFTPKNACMIHSLPVTRAELYVTNVISALVFLFVPQLLSFLAAVLLCLANGLVCVQFLALWLLSVMGISFFCFSVVCLCAMMTGQMFALPVWFVVFQYAAVGIYKGCLYVISIFGYGLSMDDLPTYDFLYRLSPLHYIVNHVGIQTIVEYDYTSNTTTYVSASLSYEGGSALLLYVALAVFLYVLSYWAYKKRRIECAGDLLVFSWVRPVFRWGVGVCLGYAAGIFLVYIFENVLADVKTPLLFVIVALAGLVCFFAAQMFVEKSFRVFRRRMLLESGIFALFVMGSFGALSGAAYQIEQYVPEASEVSTAYIYYNFPAEYDGEEIETALSVQREILSHADEYRNLTTSDGTYLEVLYRLKNGNTLARSYWLPLDDERNAWIAQTVRAQEDLEKNFLCYLIGDDYASITSFSGGYLLQEGSPNSYESVSTEIDGESAAKLYEAICLDVASGVIQKYNLSSYLYTSGSEENPDYETATLCLDYTHPTTTWKDVFSRVNDWSMDWYAYDTEMLSNGSIYLTFGADCTNLIDALVECGVVASPADIMYSGTLLE